MLSNRRTLRIEWKDCDPAGIVFFPRYFEMFDTSTTALFERALGMRAADFFETFGMIGYPLVDARARFIIPSKFSDEITIETAVAEFRRSSFVVTHRLLRGADLAVEGTEVRVWAVKDPNDATRIKSQAIPQNIVEKFTSG